MKAINNYLKFFIIIVSLTLVACENSSLKTINEKIEKEGTSATFTQKEYAAMADYLLKNYSKIMKEYNQIDLEDDDIENQIDKLDKKYPYIGEYMMILSLADFDGKLDEKTSSKVKEILNDVREDYKNDYGVDLNDKEEFTHTSNPMKLSQLFLDYCFDGYYICHIDNNGVIFYLTYIRQTGEGAIQLSNGDILFLKYNERLGQYEFCNVYTVDNEKAPLAILLDIDEDGSVSGIIQDSADGENINFSGILIEN